ncbi:hypothetical protein [Microcoleus sp. Pol17_C1]|uniref:hypothetical protein n=1 Tax=unclassified Microcoleus TaxID=2642155 RepID=UPI002FD67BF6
MSNVDGVTPNHLLQQMYGTQVLDEDVDLELSDEELELVQGQVVTSCILPNGDVKKGCSDIYYGNDKIIDYASFLAFMDREPDGWKQIDYICKKFEERRLLDCNPQGNDRNVIAAEIWQQIRDRTGVLVKQAHNGFTIDLKTGKLTYRQ